jgi:hypothetical protein
MARLSAGKDTGPDVVLFMLKEFFYRWNLVQAARHHGLDRTMLGHFEQHLLEEIQLLTHGWYDEPLYSGWRSTKDFANTGEVFGIVGRPREEEEPVQEEEEEGEEATSAAGAAASGGGTVEEEDDEALEAAEADEEAEEAEVEWELGLIAANPSTWCVHPLFPHLSHHDNDTTSPF